MLAISWLDFNSQLSLVWLSKWSRPQGGVSHETADLPIQATSVGGTNNIVKLYSCMACFNSIIITKISESQYKPSNQGNPSQVSFRHGTQFSANITCAMRGQLNWLPRNFLRWYGGNVIVYIWFLFHSRNVFCALWPFFRLFSAGLLSVQYLAAYSVLGSLI